MINNYLATKIKNIYLVYFVLFASSIAVSRRQDDSFPANAVVKNQVYFWKNIFSKYKKNQLLIHDANDSRIIIDIIDTNKFISQPSFKHYSEESLKSHLGKAYIKRYELAIERIRNLGEKAKKYGQMEKRIFDVYSQFPGGMRSLYQQKSSLRLQSGLANEFITASQRAQKYLPYMEAIFLKTGIPSKITRLAFVESMFNLDAISKVGASGIWQFMPETARSYMLVSDFFDERNNPYKATKAAAKFLKDNHNSLQTWPLAITAYNHGTRGMSKARKEVRTDELSEIIKKYKSPSFGFASKNFYAEFLAASMTYDELIKRGVIKNKNQSHKIASLILPKNFNLTQLSHHLSIPVDLILEYNRCLKPFAFFASTSDKIPKNYEIFLPESLWIKANKKIAFSK